VLEVTFVAFLAGATAFFVVVTEVVIEVVVVFFVTEAVVFLGAEAAAAALGLEDPAAVPINFSQKRSPWPDPPTPSA
jgi:hypothetical protein